MVPALYPFTLSFDGLCARFPFIFDGKPVAMTGANSDHRAPSCLISHRAAGDMAFRGVHGPVREAFFHSLNIPPERVYSLMQVHSHDVFTVGRPENSHFILGPHTKAQRHKEKTIGFTNHASPFPSSFVSPCSSCEALTGDGMVSFTPGIFLAVTVADCLPVFLLDTENGYWSVLHSGWKGTGIVLKALEIMKKTGTRPEALAAVLGPCIQSCCYRVDEERAKCFEAEFGSTEGVQKVPDTFFIDLQAANVRLLAGAGVRHIAHCTDCTFTDERLGSFRREGPESYTRMIAMAG